jgi:hypothetical protein
MLVGPATTTLRALTPPNLTVAPAAKFEPLIVTAVPPAWLPRDGATAVGVGLPATYVKPPASAPVRPSGFVTRTSTEPAACGGVTAVMVVGPSTVTLDATTPPTRTVAPALKFAPVMVIAVPPVVRPDRGVTSVTVTVVGT